MNIPFLWWFVLLTHPFEIHSFCFGFHRWPIGAFSNFQQTKYGQDQVIPDEVEVKSKISLFLKRSITNFWVRIITPTYICCLGNIFLNHFHYIFTHQCMTLFKTRCIFNVITCNTLLHSCWNSDVKKRKKENTCTHKAYFYLQFLTTLYVQMQNSNINLSIYFKKIYIFSKDLYLPCPRCIARGENENGKIICL